MKLSRVVCMSRAPDKQYFCGEHAGFFRFHKNIYFRV